MIPAGRNLPTETTVQNLNGQTMTPVSRNWHFCKKPQSSNTTKRPQNLTLLWFILHRSDNALTPRNSHLIPPHSASRHIPPREKPSLPRTPARWGCNVGTLRTPKAKPRLKPPQPPGPAGGSTALTWSAARSRRGTAGRRQRRVGEESGGGGAAERGRVTNPPAGTCPPPSPAGQRASSLPSVPSFSSLALTQNKRPREASNESYRPFPEVGRVGR